MTKEEFRTKKEIINSKMNELKNEMIKLRCVLLLMNQNDMPMSRIIGLILLTILNHCLTR